MIFCVALISTAPHCQFALCSFLRLIPMQMHFITLNHSLYYQRYLAQWVRLIPCIPPMISPKSTTFDFSCGFACCTWVAQNSSSLKIGAILRFRSNPIRSKFLQLIVLKIHMNRWRINWQIRTELRFIRVFDFFSGICFALSNMFQKTEYNRCSNLSIRNTMYSQKCAH